MAACSIQSKAVRPSISFNPGLFVSDALVSTARREQGRIDTEFIAFSVELQQQASFSS